MLTKHQSFAMRRVVRRDLVGAPYNPRVLHKIERRALTKALKRFGLLAPITVNGATVVGGHQRLAVLDALEGRDDYELDVAGVDLTPEQEREANVLLNSDHVQGSWDLEKLEALLHEEGVSFERIGLEREQIEGMFGAAFFAGVQKESEALLAAVEAVEAIAPPKTDVEPTEREKAIAHRAEMRKTHKLEQDSIVCVVFTTVEECDAFVSRFAYEPGVKYVDGVRVTKVLDGHTA